MNVETSARMQNESELSARECEGMKKFAILKMKKTSYKCRNNNELN